MKKYENTKLTGKMTMVLTKADGQIEVTHKDNIIVDVGFDMICDSLAKSSGRPAVLSHIGVGTGATAPVPGDTDLGATSLRKTATYAHTAGTKVFSMSTTFLPGEATAAITEAGVFNAVSAGAMLDRVTFPVVNKGADDTLQTVFTFTLS